LLCIHVKVKKGRGRDEILVKRRGLGYVPSEYYYPNIISVIIIIRIITICILSNVTPFGTWYKY
jgi:hypothetical protein